MTRTSFRSLRTAVGDRIRAAVAGELSRAEDERRAETAELQTKLANTEVGLAELRRMVNLMSPALWNDLHRRLASPLPTPQEFVSEPGAREEIERCISIYDGTPQGRALHDLGADKVMDLLRRDSLPTPAPEDREMYLGDDHLAYLVSGVADAVLLAEVAAAHDVLLDEHATFLDFGCSSGRVLRAFSGMFPHVLSIGIDLGVVNVTWAREHLRGPRMVVAQGTTVPTLPLPDSAIDLIFAGSVFTHIADFEEAWLLELARVLRPGGLALVTVHSERIWSDMRDEEHLLTGILSRVRHDVDPPGVPYGGPELFASPMPSGRVVFTAVDWLVNNTNVIHSDAWIRERWGTILEPVATIENAHGNHQDALLMRKREHR